MLLSVGAWGQTKTIMKDTVFVKSKKEFNRIIKNVIPPDTPNSRCFTYTIKNEGGNAPNGGYWVSTLRKELKLIIQSGWNLRPLNWPSNVRIVSSSRLGNTYTYILDTTASGTYQLPLTLQNQADSPCYGNITINLTAINLTQSGDIPRRKQ